MEGTDSMWIDCVSGRVFAVMQEDAPMSAMQSAKGGIVTDRQYFNMMVDQWDREIEALVEKYVTMAESKGDKVCDDMMGYIMDDFRERGKWTTLRAKGLRSWSIRQREY